VAEAIGHEPIVAFELVGGDEASAFDPVHQERARLPTKSPWLNPIEPKWVHGNPAVAEPARLLSMTKLIHGFAPTTNANSLTPLHKQIVKGALGLAPLRFARPRLTSSRPHSGAQRAQWSLNLLTGARSRSSEATIEPPAFAGSTGGMRS
jgi:hypothetical protein